ncbi:hypothetical protein PHO31112_00773 [Pandoraea horticolens]|uniref:Uncharacterized protein n=1 Tax=Pandoraea horticolens TaxID=2508298 RepID=A0A5E4SGA2_9BURK|nr:hypothetical protein [Pandoraea horticolens]VVD74687.1 hypothetical protein PHO31112_00773 [Pandoraea horticolens]
MKTLNEMSGVITAPVDVVNDRIEYTVTGWAYAGTLQAEESEPTMCIGCGSVRKPTGEMPCDH